MSGVETKAVMDAVVQRLGGRRGNACWGDMVREWMRLQPALSLAEWEEFLRLCGEANVPRDAEELHFRFLVGLMATYGNDGYNNRPADMTRVVYWFQHLNLDKRARCCSPRH